ncbi:MAG: tail fiber domain-containing protein, partial [Ferruginibacter sp.]
TTGLYNTAVGAAALYYNHAGIHNTATGAQALYNDSTAFASDNTANGYQALFFNNGNENTAIGSVAMLNNTNGYQNTAIGSRALWENITGSRNTAVGATTLSSNTSGTGNTATGTSAMDDNTVGGANTATGYSALLRNISGNENTADGYQAMLYNSTGNQNTALGINALAYNVGGHNNIAIGANSGIHPNSPNTFNTISIGNDDYLNGYQNQVIIGNTSMGWIGGVTTWSTFSDARMKSTITEDVKGLDFILRLRPVTYNISQKAIAALTGNKSTPDFPGKYDNEKIRQTGFLAQDVEQAAKSSGYDFSGYSAPKGQSGIYSISYEQFVVPLVKAVQEQQAIIDKLTLELTKNKPLTAGGNQEIIIAGQQKQIDLLEKRLAALEAKQ